jgi:hypothetical protein
MTSAPDIAMALNKVIDDNEAEARIIKMKERRSYAMTAVILEVVLHYYNY